MEVGSISSLIMELMNLEDDDSSVFITQTPSITNNEESLMDLLEDSLDESGEFFGTDNGQSVGSM